MSSVVASCSQPLVDGACPEGALTWITLVDPFAMPSADVLMKAAQDVAFAFALPTFIVMIASLAVVWIHEAIN